jgi:hypothetical protein
MRCSVIKKRDLPQLQGICQRNEHADVRRPAPLLLLATFDIVTQRVSQGLELRDGRGWSPVFNSVVFNDLPCFKQLVRVGANIMQYYGFAV